MRDIKTKLLRSEGTSSGLKRKLSSCGTKLPLGIRYFCSSYACDKCRRHRARGIAKAITQWADTPYHWLLRRVLINLSAYTTPAALLDGIEDTRARLRQRMDRHQREDRRWSGVRMQGIFRPVYDPATRMWSAVLYGVVHVGPVGEGWWLDAIEPLVHQVRVESIGLDEIPDHVAAGMSVNGLSGCTADDLASLYNAIARRGETKALVYRRGVGRP